MPVLTNTVPNTATAAERTVLEDIFARMKPRFFDVRFHDGSVWAGDLPTPKFTLALRHEGSLRRMFWPPRALTFDGAYVYDDYEVEGDMLAFQDLCAYLMFEQPKLPLMHQLRVAWRLWRLPRHEPQRTGREPIQLAGAPHSRERDLAAIRYHYDLPAAFFEKFLGPAMLYTSGVWESPEETLETAQERKLDLICQKLRVKPGDRLLDIGCGWGMLGIHAAKKYGVKSVAVTISQTGAAWARERIRAEGLEESCKVELLDYRDMPEQEPFDHITCIEVGEHFGPSQLATYWSKCYRLLRPGGRILHQQIETAGHTGMPKMTQAFSHRFIFPDGELVPLNLLLRHAEESGLEIRDVEGLREHYPLTLKHWLANLEVNEESLTALTDKATYRAFRIYLGGAAWGFNNYIYNLYQILVVKPDQCRSGLPLSRRDWYAYSPK